MLDHKPHPVSVVSFRVNLYHVYKVRQSGSPAPPEEGLVSQTRSVSAWEMKFMCVVSKSLNETAVEAIDAHKQS